MSEWKECKLGDVADLVDSLHKTPKKYSDHGYPMVRVTDVKKGKLDLSNTFKVDKNTFEEFSMKYKPKEGDIIFTRVGSYGNTCLVGKDTNFCLGQNTAFIVPNQNPYFIYYFLNSPEAYTQIEGSVGGSTQPTISLKSIKEINIFLPSYPEQCAIASVLSGLDDKIDLFHRQNTTLEAMAETLFRQWFVEDAYDGQIGQVSDLIEFNPTRNLSKGTIAPYLEMANVNTDVFHPDSWYDREFSLGTKFINGDTLLARITPCLENGKSTYVTFLKEGQVGWGSTEFIVLRSKRNLHPLFTYVLARNTDFRDYAEGCLEGSSGRQRVNVDHLVKFEIIIPTDLSN